MTSLSALAQSYKNRKIEASKHRRQVENKLKFALSLKRRSTSGLASLERRKEDIIRKKDDIAQLLNQYLAQRDSVQRLKISAEERLGQEQQSRDEVQQQSEYAESAEKSQALERLKIIDDKIAELESEIKQREIAEGRLVKTIADLERQKTRTDADLKRQASSKPSLLEQLKSSTKDEVRLRPHVQSLIKREAQVNSDLSKIIQKLRIAQAAKRKAQRIAAAKRRSAQRKAAAKRRAAQRRSAKRKTSSKRKAQKRAKTKTRKAPKRKISKQKKPSKRKIKRKAAKKVKRSKRR